MDYEARCREAATEQGLDPVIATLTAAGLLARAEQTGGFTMVACVYEPARPHHYVGITLETSYYDERDGTETNRYLVAGYGPDGWQDGETLSEDALLDELEGLARGWLWPFDWPPREPGPNPFCLNRSPAGDACGVCDGCAAEVDRLEAPERRAARFLAEVSEPIPQVETYAYAGASNAELADALEGFGDGQADDLGAMVTEAARRLRPVDTRLTVGMAPTLTIGELEAGWAHLPKDTYVTVGTPDGGWLNVDGMTDPTETDEPSLIVMTRDDFDTRQW